MLYKLLILFLFTKFNLNLEIDLIEHRIVIAGFVLHLYLFINLKQIHFYLG